MRIYVVGLLFDNMRSKITLIEKKHGPPCVIGKWNGVGGHVEKEEGPLDAMIREFKEETGVLFRHWNELCSLVGEEHIVFFYYGEDTSVQERVKTTEDEQIVVFDIGNLPDNIIENVDWMIRFLVDPFIDHGTLGELKTSRIDT